MSDTPSEIISTWVVCSTAWPGVQLRKTSQLRILVHFSVIHRWPADSPHRGPVIRKAFPCHAMSCRLRNGALQWRHNGRDSVSNHQPHECLLNRLFRPRSKTTSKLRVTGPCVGNSPGTGEFPAQMTSNAENVSIWWRHHAAILSQLQCVRTQRRPFYKPYFMCSFFTLFSILIKFSLQFVPQAPMNNLCQ